MPTIHRGGSGGRGALGSARVRVDAHAHAPDPSASTSSSDGVPPPRNTDESVTSCAHGSSPSSSSSRRTARTYRSMAPSSTGAVLKLQ